MIVPPANYWPQVEAICRKYGILHHDIGDVRQGKYIELLITEKNKDKAKAQIEDMCQKLLANTVIENYRYELSDE